MSRIGRMPISIPNGVEVAVDGSTVQVKGPKGELKREVPADMELVIDNGILSVGRPSDAPVHRSMHGLTRSLVANMVQGVSGGFEKKLELTGVGYKASMQGTKLVLAVGYSHLVEMEPPAGITIEVPAPNRITVKGIDKELVGAISANIRSVRPPEPYKGKGIRYEGEYIRRKAGKAGIKR
ncbi:MAG: 50S ribosomal protein L6 [Eubacteriales bacterium]|nr:50S ribosomal protein L6 [Bacillota bacterium]MBV1728180.1 50S ribosomal protein L6 [Desulforudis sp.]MDP3050908.1 50S ribosomal protein L6 [Eubacteriales bacterium]MDQ7789994.1 50S ribosomal protein L6 [Clostridia bacterium]MBU4533899.1 50S ribosomal protein L6 [Bacillota bacterium]